MPDAPFSESLFYTALGLAWAMNDAILALLTGALTGATFKLIDVPIPAPPEIPGILGIVGIYLGYKLIENLGWSVDVLEVLGI